MSAWVVIIFYSNFSLTRNVELTWTIMAVVDWGAGDVVPLFAHHLCCIAKAVKSWTVVWHIQFQVVGWFGALLFILQFFFLITTQRRNCCSIKATVVSFFLTTIIRCSVKKVVGGNFLALGTRIASSLLLLLLLFLRVAVRLVLVDIVFVLFIFLHWDLLVRLFVVVFIVVVVTSAAKH